MTNVRTSLGGNVLGDATSRYNLRSSSAPRRMSYGGTECDSDGVKKDRRAMLEEWRRQARNRNNPPILSSSAFSSSSDAEEPESKRTRLISSQPIETPPLPAPSTEGTTALQRFRMRRQQQQQEENKENSFPHLLPPQPPSSSASFSEGTTAPSPRREVGNSTIFSSKRMSSAKKARRSLSAGAIKRSRHSISPGDFVAPPPLDQTAHTSSTTSTTAQENLDSIESAGFRSRIQEMQQRITQLEKEKLDLTKSKAPLEARFRQKEDAWLKEQNRLLQEVDDLKVAVKEADERYRSLDLQKQALEEERARLKYEALKAASTLRLGESGDDDDSQDQNYLEVIELKDKLKEAEDEIKTLRLEMVSLESDLNATQDELDSVNTSYRELQLDYQELLVSKSKVSDAEIQLQVLTREHIATSAQLNAVCADLAATRSSAQAAMEKKEKEWKEEATQLRFENNVLKTRNGNMEDQKAVKDGVEDEAVLLARIAERDVLITELRAQVNKGEQTRRMMHNRIQELRGNIRVFVRTRPFLPCDNASGVSSIEVLPDGESLLIADRNDKNNQNKFTFDKVFLPSSGQNCVFQEVSDFVQSALDGYHVCLFSYGQTGSGKTHTMQGSGNGAMKGIIPRAVEQILAQAKVLESQKWEFRMTASFLEIYNEKLIDLLREKENSCDGVTTRSSKKTGKLSIKRHAKGNSFVDGLTKVAINTTDSETGMFQLEEIMSTAARSRSVASTNMNAQSSRSHSVFMLHLNGINVERGTVVQGALNLCDLAGSERLDRSGAGSDPKRLKETQAINKSLSCLGDVFNALANKSSHIPYRNSKLTYLLQDCLSGDGKALMFVNLSPTLESCHESLCSLRFAQRVNQVELGKATKHVKYSSKNG